MAKRLSIVVLIFCVAGLMLGCPKKQVKKEEPGMKAADSGSAATDVEKEKAARDAAEKARLEREAQEKKAREEEARRKAADEELKKSLTQTTTPGIEGSTVTSTLLKNIYFDFDRYDVRPGDTEILKANAAVLKKYPNMKIQVEGHCDERGTREYNLALGERRANSAKAYMVSLGIGAERVSTISFGKEMPDDPGHTEAAWAKNRRARFVIVSK
jgi:peptidoglycan-associated lipoprotein